MAYSKISNTWDAGLCNTEIEVSDRKLKCTCNAFKSDLSGVFTDSTRVLDPTVLVFPEIKQTNELTTDN